ncbi:MAG: TorF family putative porin [Proteobacteria bacterium]|nr:TorF family putative porin [Pseudomonadota bacterium]
MINIQRFGIAVTALAVAGLLPAQAEWSMNVGVTSDYVYRGLTQTTGKPAISGGFDYEDEGGFFFGGWVSNVDYGNFEVIVLTGEDTTGVSVLGTPVSDPSVEMDLYVGYAESSGEDDFFGYSITYFQYIYPYDNLRGSNYGDLVFDFNVTDFIFGFSYTTDAEVNGGIDPENLGTFNEVGDLFFYLGYTGEYDSGWSFTTTLNFHTFATDKRERTEIGNPSFYWYMDFGATKSTDYGEVKFTMSKVFNYIAAPGVAYTSERGYRPYISWTSYF